MLHLYLVRSRTSECVVRPFFRSPTIVIYAHKHTRMHCCSLTSYAASANKQDLWTMEAGFTQMLKHWRHAAATDWALGTGITSHQANQQTAINSCQCHNEVQTCPDNHPRDWLTMSLCKWCSTRHKNCTNNTFSQLRSLRTNSPPGF